MRASERVGRCLKAGWHSCCDGAVAVQWFRFQPRSRRGEYQTLHVVAGDHKIAVSVSPTGRSVRVFVNGEEIQ